MSGPPPRISEREFGRTAGGEAVRELTVRNARDTTIGLLTLGANLHSVRTRGRAGSDEITLAFADVAPYDQGNAAYFGAVIGRFANRISRGGFELDGRWYPLAGNANGIHLHGGANGFDRRLWRAEPFTGTDAAGVAFSYLSADGEEAYPGALDVRVQYTLSDDDVMTIDYQATSDRPTLCNLTNHVYWNLAGSTAAADGTTVEGHVLELPSGRYLETDADTLPTGNLLAVAGTPFDFRRPRRIGEQIAAAGGYDTCYEVAGDAGSLRHCGTLSEPDSGRRLDFATTAPGFQLYTGEFLDRSSAATAGFGRRTGLCIETQCYPDAPHHEHFPSAVLRPGQTYRHATTVRFSRV